MWAIVEYKGFQFYVKEKEKILVPLTEMKDEEIIEMTNVLLLKKDEKIFVGKPYVKGAKIRAKILGNKKGKKNLVFKMKAKKRYRRKKGHRQEYTQVLIEEIKAPEK